RMGRIPRMPMTPRGPAARLISTRKAALYRNRAEMLAGGLRLIPGTDWSHCCLFAPILGSKTVLGMIGVEDHEREDAFGESEVRLLQTVGASMGVALENARLFAESEQRNAELAVINSVQAALAAELDIQGIYDAVGDKIREIFHHTDMGIRIYDPKTNLVHFPYAYENGKRISIPSGPLRERGFAAHVIRSHET